MKPFKNAHTLIKNSINKKSFSESIQAITSKYIVSNRTNTIINICKQNEDIVIERLGKFNRLQKSGIFIAIPIIDKIRYVFDNRELTIPIEPQHATTQDNVVLSIAGVVYIKFLDTYKTAYGVSEPIYAVSQFAQSAMRAIVGKHALDEIFHNRDNLNEYIIKSLEEGVKNWGIGILRYEITDIIVSSEIKDAMLRQASAERKRREDVLHAEALKRSQILESEGLKQKLINESEGKKIQIENEASAEGNAIKIRADATKYEVVVSAQAKAEALKIIGSQLETREGQQAAQIELARMYIEQFGKIIGKSNNVVIPQDMNDIGGLVAKAMSIAQVVDIKKQFNDKI
jgi:regulator of protease activity HflC (stomatin/prohibitin superfamily)